MGRYIHWQKPKNLSALVFIGLIQTTHSLTGKKSLCSNTKWLKAVKIQINLKLIDILK